MRLRTSLAVCALLPLTAADAETIILARSGQPAAAIVVPADPAKPVELAATELQTCVRKICGVELPIRRDGKRVDGAGLYIGRCEPTREADLPPETVNPEAYAITVREGSIFFAGRYPTPTYFAVASFIEDALGVRWFAPGDDWEYVPPGTSGELAVSAHRVMKVPDTSPRIWSRHDFFDSYSRWNLRNKTVQGERIPRRQFQNHLHTVFPPGKYAKTHPEYYPLVDGKRWIPEGDYRYWRPCESNPDVLRLTVEAACKWFDKNPWSDSFSVGMDDIAHVCGCPNCRAMDPHLDSYEKREFSDRHYKFVNAVAREVARTHPDKYVGTLIYSIARHPPATVPRLEDNVFGYITEVSARWCEPGRREADQALTREWSRRCKHLSRYEYMGLGTFTPRYYPHTMAEALKYDKSLGLEGMYTELNTFLPHTAPMVWALARLQWDSKLDIDALLGEFMGKMFGPATATMAEYFDLLEKSWNDWPATRDDWEHRDIFIQAQAISPQAVDRGLALLDRALQQVDSEVVRRRIETVRAGLRYSGYAIKAYAQSEELLRMPLAGGADAERMLERVTEIMRLSGEREPFWAAAMERSDLLGESIRGLNQRGYIQIGKVGNLERGGSVGGLRLLDWYAEHEPARLPEIGAKLTRMPGGQLAELMRAWLWVREHAPANLIRNPGFEQLASTAGAASQPAEGTPPAQWTAYNSGDRAKFGVDHAVTRTGAGAARIAGAKSGAVYLQPHNARPGERYLCVAYARSEPDQGGTRGYLAVRLQTPRGEWHPRRDFERQVYMTPGRGWQPLILLVDVPEGAGKVIVMVGAKEQTDATAVLFDDVALYRLPENLVAPSK